MQRRWLSIIGNVMTMRLNPFFQEMVRGSGSSPSDRLPFTPPTLPEPQLSVSELIVEAGKKRRGEPNKLDATADQDKTPAPGDLIRDAIRRQREGK
jgi:hypothetical protein